MTVGDNPLHDPTVRAAIELAERTARFEVKQDAMLDHLGRIDGHLAALNGRTEKAEAVATALAGVIDKHLTEVAARNEYARLVDAESTITKLQRGGLVRETTETTVKALNKRDLAFVGGLLAVMMGLADTFIKPLIERLFS